MNFYTYLWLREDGTPYYVGKGSGIRAYTSWSHGVHKPTCPERIIVQEWPCEEDALEAEKFLIFYYGRLDQGTGILRNLTDGGENPPSRKGKKHSEETLRKMSESMKKNGHTPSFKGRVHSPFTRALISKANKGKTRGPHSEEHRKNIGEALRGRTYASKGKPWTTARRVAQENRHIRRQQ